MLFILIFLLTPVTGKDIRVYLMYLLPTGAR
jgi:hypothetical protein